MKNILCLMIVSSLWFGVAIAASKEKPVKSLVLHYDELEKGVDVQNMRYLINSQFMRIDSGDDNADYILFDVNKKIIYSVNHDDQTILKIDNNEWQQPKFDFKVKIDQTKLSDAPKIQNKTVHRYEVKAVEKICTTVLLIKDIYIDEMKILYQYQQVLSGQQVRTLNSTPKEMQSPCFLVDQVYHVGDYYKLGLPVKITYSRDYAKFLKHYRYLEVNEKLFKLPKKYQEYKAFGSE